MPTTDQHLGPNAPTTANTARDYSDAVAGRALPLPKKRIMYRYWLAAIIAGGAIWAGVAYALGLI